MTPLSLPRPGRRPLWPVVAAIFVVGSLVARCDMRLAYAAPPAIGSEDAQVMQPYADWIRSLKTRQGVTCCDVADCRPVEARATANGWQVRWRPGQIPGAPTDWTDVPPEAVLARENPSGTPIACWHDGAVRCFVPGGAT